MHFGTWAAFKLHERDLGHGPFTDAPRACLRRLARVKNTSTVIRLFYYIWIDHPLVRKLVIALTTPRAI